MTGFIGVDPVGIRGSGLPQKFGCEVFYHARTPRKFH